MHHSSKLIVAGRPAPPLAAETAAAPASAGGRARTLRRPLRWGRIRGGLVALLVSVLALAFWPFQQTGADDEFLHPDKAFRVSAKANGPAAVKIRWEIAEGYYLYRDKFAFQAEQSGFVLGDPLFPEAETREDQFFGKVQIYRDHVDILLPLERTAEAGRRLTLKTTWQGCAEAGFCYPPQRKDLNITLPRMSAAARPSAMVDAGASGRAEAGFIGLDPLAAASDETPSGLEVFEAGSGSGSTTGSDRAGGLGADVGVAPDAAQRLATALGAAPGDGQATAFAPVAGSSLASGLRPSLGLEANDEVLPVEQAFRFAADLVAPDQIALTWEIAPGTYLYSHLLEVVLEDAEAVEIGRFERPAGVLKSESVLPDGSIGDVEAYYGRIDLLLPLLRGTSEATEVTLVARYQGCAEIGICYPPQTQRIRLSLPPSPVASAADEGVGRLDAAPTAGPTPPSADEPTSEQDRIASVLANSSLWVVVAAFFGFGLLLSLTPCVFPMIPILSGIIAGQGANMTTRKAFVLSLVYVLAMALTYTLVGVLAGLFGANLQAAFQNPWILSVFALVFVLLALSMFGFYDLQLPSRLQTRLAAISNRQEGGTLIGVAIMGLLSALIVGPCVAPPLFGALIYISQTGDALLGGVALFALSMGMGAPLIAIGTSAGKLLPRAGPWTDAVKAVFGVILLGVAIYLLERILPPALSMLLWGALLICSAVYMGALSPLPEGRRGWRALWKGLGLVLLLYGALMLVGAAAGGRDTLQPLRGLAPAATGPGVMQADFTRVKTVADLEREIAKAGEMGKPVMLDFYADWCVACKELERYTFSEPAVIAEMGRFVLLKADVTANDADDQALMHGRFGIPGPPAILFFGPNGEELRGYRLVGFKPADAFVQHLRRVSP